MFDVQEEQNKNKKQTVQHFTRGRAKRRCAMVAFPGFKLPAPGFSIWTSVGACDLVRGFFDGLGPPSGAGGGSA